MLGISVISKANNEKVASFLFGNEKWNHYMLAMENWCVTGLIWPVHDTLHDLPLATLKSLSCKCLKIEFTVCFRVSLDLASLLQKPVVGGREAPSSSSSQSLVFTNSHHHHHQPPPQQQQAPPSRNTTSGTSYAHAALVKTQCAQFPASFIYHT